MLRKIGIEIKQGLEKKTNPFMRPDSPELRKTLGMENASDVDVLGETRRRKDSF